MHRVDAELRAELRAWAEASLQVQVVGRSRPSAGLAYERHAWGPRDDPPFDWADGIALRHRWRERPDGVEVRARASGPRPARVAFSGPRADALLAALLAATGGFDRRGLRVDGQAAEAVARDLGPGDFVVAGPDRPVDRAHLDAIAALRSLDLDVFAEGLAAFRWYACTVASAEWPVPGFALYGGPGLREEVERAAAELGLTLRYEPVPAWTGDPGLPEPAVDADVVDLAGLNVARLPARGSARELVLDDTAVVDLEPLASWDRLVSLSLRRLAPRSLAPVPIERLTRLVVDGADRGVLTDLRPSWSLRSLRVERGDWVDLSEVDRFPELRELAIEAGSVGSLAGVEGLPQLESLELRVGAAPERWGLLGRLPRLRSLSIRTTGELDLADLPDLPHLQRLELAGLTGRWLRLRHPERLARFPALERLGLAATDLADARHVPASVRELDLAATDLTDLRPLAGLRLRRLALGTAEPVDASPLYALTALEALDVRGLAGPFDPRRLGALGLRALAFSEELGALDALRGLPALRELSGPIRSLRGAAELPALEVLAATGDGDPSPLAGHPTLRALTLGDPVEDLAPLAALALTELRVTGRLRAIAPLVGLPLRVLGLPGARIPDPDALARLTGLEELDASRSDLRSLDPLADLPALRRLAVSGRGEALDAGALLRMRPLAALTIDRASVRAALGAVTRRHHTRLVGEG